MEAVESYIGEQGIAVKGKEVKVVITTNRTASITLTNSTLNTVNVEAPRDPEEDNSQDAEEPADAENVFK